MKVTQIYRFHLNLFAAIQEESLACTWEEAAAKLEQLRGMIFELDGSFVVSGDDEAGRRWHVDGHLFDFDGRLHRMELHGQCPPESFDELLRCIGWPGRQLVFELVREGTRIDEASFRQNCTS
jgi:hypothetical protein